VDYLVNSWSQERVDQGLPIQFPHLSVGDVVQQHNYKNSDYWTVDASYLRLKNAEIGYSINPNWLSKRKISSIRFYVNANNLLTWSSLFPGIDPESDPGVTNEEPYPITRTVNFGGKIQF
jgi:hypothetical protein